MHCLCFCGRRRRCSVSDCQRNLQRWKVSWCRRLSSDRLTIYFIHSIQNEKEASAPVMHRLMFVTQHQNMHYRTFVWNCRRLLRMISGSMCGFDQSHLLSPDARRLTTYEILVCKAECFKIVWRSAGATATSPISVADVRLSLTQVNCEQQTDQ